MIWVILGIVVAVAVVVVAAVWARAQRSRKLRDRFGPEYRRTVEREGDAGAAEAELRRRERRRKKLEIRSLPVEARREYSNRWKAVQTRFVDEPARAVGEADQLIGEAMGDRGYPVEDFDQRAADISVDHPDVVEDYRAAHEIATANRDEQASTEDLRLAMVRYRSLFVRLIEADNQPTGEATR
jgi:FtsZ-interacting cell division protein ZipA